MAQIRSIEARSLLDEIAQFAIQSNIDLLTAIRANKTALNTGTFKQGRIFISTSGNGQSASFAIASQLAADFTPTRVNAQFMEFIEIWNDCVTSTTITDTVNTTAAVTNANLAAMLADDRLQTITARETDYTGIRFPYGGVPQ